MAQDEGAGGPCNLDTGWGLSQMVCYQALPQLCHVILDTPLHFLPVTYLLSVNHILFLTLVLYLPVNLLGKG